MRGARDFDKVNGVWTHPEAHTLKIKIKKNNRRSRARCVWQFVFTIFRVFFSSPSFLCRHCRRRRQWRHTVRSFIHIKTFKTHCGVLLLLVCSAYTIRKALYTHTLNVIKLHDDDDYPVTWLKEIILYIIFDSVEGGWRAWRYIELIGFEFFYTHSFSRLTFTFIIYLFLSLSDDDNGGPAAPLVNYCRLRDLSIFNRTASRE